MIKNSGLVGSHGNIEENEYNNRDHLLVVASTHVALVWQKQGFKS